MKQRRLMQILVPVIISVLTCMCVSGCAGKKEIADATPAQTLLERLNAIHDRGVTLLGHDDDPVYGHGWYGDTLRSDILEIVGDYPAIMSWDLGGLEQGWSKNLDSVPFSRIKAEVGNQHKRGGINTFSWHLFNPITGADAWTIGDSLTVKKIINEPAANTTFREQVNSIASFFNSLTDDAGNKIPVIFRPLHENSGNWFWWGKPYATPDQYKKLWEIIREEFDNAGINNVVYAYSPDRIYTEEEYLEYYPGDDLVDILGVDIYLFNGKEGVDEYIKTADRALSIITGLSRERGKISAFTETGSETIPIPDWWTEILLPLLKKHNVAYFVLWRNAHDLPHHYYAPFPGHPSAASFKKFCNDSIILLSKDLK